MVTKELYDQNWHNGDLLALNTVGMEHHLRKKGP